MRNSFLGFTALAWLANFFIFAGYETAYTANDEHLAGRLTFVRNF
jgi:hypothetical protein